MKVFEIKKGWENCRDGNVMMAIEGIEETAEKIEAELKEDGYKAVAQEEGDKEGTTCIIYVIKRSEVDTFKARFKSAKKNCK